MSLIFTVGEFQAMPRWAFYRRALRAILATGCCSAEQEARLIAQIRREEAAYR